jgi:hypothetical protein
LAPSLAAPQDFDINLRSLTQHGSCPPTHISSEPALFSPTPLSGHPLHKPPLPQTNGKERYLNTIPHTCIVDLPSPQGPLESLLPNPYLPLPSNTDTLHIAKSRVIAVRLLSMAMTGFYRTMRRPRTSRPLSMLKYDPVGTCTFSASLSYTLRRTFFTFPRLLGVGKTVRADVFLPTVKKQVLFLEQKRGGKR